MRFPWRGSDDEKRISPVGLLALIAVMLTALLIALPIADSVLADPDLRFLLLIIALGVLVLLLVRRLYPEAEVRYDEGIALVDTTEAGAGVREKDWLTLYIELRAAARRRLAVRRRLSEDELERALAGEGAEDLVRDQKLVELLTCDLKKRYLWPGADLEATFMDLLRRVEAMQ
jgi:hypothetical protein